MPEQPIRFGAADNLVGIVSMPEADSRPSIGCLLLNAGVIHRVGPHRINVKLARRLAAQGIPSLRMDLSGMGDSGAATTSLEAQVQAVRDLQDGISALEERTGVQRVAVVGICSGAVSAYNLALADPRVGGLLMFDGFTFPTLLTHVIRRWRRFCQAPLRVVLSGIRRLFQPRTEPAAEPLATPEDQKPTREAFAAALEGLVRRNVAIFIVYSGSFLEQHNYARQLEHAFGNAAFLSHIRHAYLPSIDHTLTPIAAQRTFVNLVGEWVRDASSNFSRLP